jgi:hypothetical protein
VKYIVGSTLCLGLVMGVFWLFAIDAGINGAQWVPNWNSWIAYATCPFVHLVGLNRLSNFFMPVLNAAFYELVGYAVARISGFRQMRSGK